MVSRNESQTTDFFCSHGWSEPFREFMATIDEFVRSRKVTEDQGFWICVYANGKALSTPQCVLTAMCADQWVVDLGETLVASPFFETLKGARETLVMVDRNADVLTRLWVRTTAASGACAVRQDKSD